MTIVNQTRPKRKIHRALVIALSLALLGAGVYFLQFQTYHLATVKAGVLYRDGNRGMREYTTAIRKVRPKVVVSLLDDNEMADPDEPQFAKEEAFLKEHGIRLERIKVKLGGWPQGDDLQRFIDIVNDPKNQPVLVHCAQGVRRTGMFVAAYQCSVLKMSKDQARQSILKFGHGQRSIGDVEKFIDAYDPASRTMTKTFAQSKE
jgi:protein tyrosine phosphatase (PTP) superfamily phosphohydrolase (DUF442 family)